MFFAMENRYPVKTVAVPALFIRNLLSYGK